MNSFIDRILGRNQTSAKSAKERLQFVLVHDRTDITPAVMEQLKDEIIAVISRHVEIDSDNVDITLSQNQRENRLVANIPLLDGRKRRR